MGQIWISHFYKVPFQFSSVQSLSPLPLHWCNLLPLTKALNNSRQIGWMDIWNVFTS